MFRTLVAAIVLMAGALTAPAATVLVEAESFSNVGGWGVDQQSMDSPLASAYLLAHGIGKPVADATTTVTLPAPGEYRVFVHTKDWVARWKAPGAPGKFQLLVDGKPLAETFGTKGADWSWHDGGKVTVAGKEIKLALHDLTGFEGRCDAIVFTSDAAFTPPADPKAMTAFRRKALGLPEKPEDGGTYDLVVIGGGIPGCTAAITAARLGLKVALIQDRPVLGGNASSEVRVWINGKIYQQPYPILGEVTALLDQKPKACPGPASMYPDDHRHKAVEAEPNVKLLLWEHVFAVEMDAGRVKAVISKNVLSNRETRFAAPLFVDCSGDGTVGALAGADSETTAKQHMGATNHWLPRDTGAAVEFPRCPWALDLTDKPFPTKLAELGRWFWESGFDFDSVTDAEAIRDHNLRAMYGAWDCLKNVKKMYPTHELEWSAFISGKRESRRLLGDVILTKEDVVSNREWPDACFGSTWSIDLHYPDTRYTGACPENPFISKAEYTKIKPPYAVPYRCLYSRNIPNLMMAGRNVSVTHEALGTVRVMGTGGLMGEVLGRAAFLCKQHNTTPRGVYEKHLDELKALLQKHTGKEPPPPPAPAAAPAPRAAVNPLEGQVGANVAPKARVTTSGDKDATQFPSSRLIDGAVRFDNDQRWMSTTGVPNWVELAWDAPQKIAAVRVLSGYVKSSAPSDPITDFALQMHDGTDWKDIAGTRTTGNTTVNWTCKFEPVSAARVRLLVEKSQVDVSRIWEIELYEPVAK